MFDDIDDVLQSVSNKLNTSLVTDLAVVEKKIDYLANGGESDSFNGLMHHAVFPQWFFTARIGQPRRINYLEIRKFAQSPWVQMVLNSIKKQVMTTPWEIESVDEDEGDQYEDDKKQLSEWFERVDEEGRGIVDLAVEGLTDIGEIDALSWVKVFSSDSYDVKTVNVEDDVGNVVGTEERLVLKPFGQRKLLYLQSADPSTFLKQIDIFKRLKAYYQYSWKNPRASPIRFEPDEVAYNFMNKKSYELYGFSPVQSIQQILELLIQSTRWNKDYFKNNAFPDGILALPNADKDSMKLFKEMWMKEVKGKPHKLIWHNTDAKFSAFNLSNKDMEWLNGQKWFFHLVFAVYGLSPAEAGFYEDVNRSAQEGQERVSVKNAVKPFLHIIEDTINRFIIPEFLQDKNPKVRFCYKPADHDLEVTEFNQAMQEISQGTLTVNEYRVSVGREPIAEQSSDEDSENGDDNSSDEDAEKLFSVFINKEYQDSFESFFTNKNADSPLIKKNYFYKKGFESFLTTG